MAYGAKVTNTNSDGVFDDTFSAFSIWTELSGTVAATTMTDSHPGAGSAPPNQARLDLPQQVLIATGVNAPNSPAVAVDAAFWNGKGLMILVNLPNQWFFHQCNVNVVVHAGTSNPKEYWFSGVTVRTYAPVGTAVSIKICAATHAIIPADTTPYGMRVFDSFGKPTFDSRLKYPNLKGIGMVPVNNNMTPGQIITTINNQAFICAPSGDCNMSDYTSVYFGTGKNTYDLLADAFLFFKYSTNLIESKWISGFWRLDFGSPSPAYQYSHGPVLQEMPANITVPVLIF
jgi:hypothetical protein